MLIKALAIWCAISTTGCTESQQLEGAWNLQQYVMAGEEQENVSGLLVLAEGRFGLIYTMHRNGELNGRGHAGGYTSEEDRLIFDVEWWPEEVDGVARAAAPAREVAKINTDGEILEMRFGSGSLQRWHRAVPTGQKTVARALQLQSIETNGRQQDASGVFVQAEGQFALFAETVGGDGSVDVHAYGGSTSRGGESEGDGDGFGLVGNWYVAFMEGEGRVSNDEQSMTLQLQDEEAALVHAGNGRTFRLER